jgi:hypothetical protein
MKFLRLDMYLNGRETLVGTAEATRDGFESLMCHDWIVFKRVAAEIEATGVSQLTAAEIEDEDMREILWDIFDREIATSETVDFCMCLWQEIDREEEHLMSAYKLEDCEAE